MSRGVFVAAHASPDIDSGAVKNFLQIIRICNI